MVALGFTFAVLYPEALYRSAFGWVWDYPARDPIKSLPIVDFANVSGIVHATVMFVDASSLPAAHSHSTFEGDVFGTFLAPPS